MNNIFTRGIFFIGVGIVIYGLVKMWRQYKEIDRCQKYGLLNPREIQTRFLRAGVDWIVVTIGVFICFCVVCIRFL